MAILRPSVSYDDCYLPVYFISLQGTVTLRLVPNHLPISPKLLYLIKNWQGAISALNKLCYSQNQI